MFLFCFSIKIGFFECTFCIEDSNIARSFYKILSKCNIIKGVYILHYSGLIVILIGVIIVVRCYIPKKHIIMESTLDLKEKTQSDDFETPVKSKLEIKLNGTRKQNVHFELHKKTRIWTGHSTYTLHSSSPPIVRDMKGNGKDNFDLESNYKYSFSVKLEPLMPFIIEYNILEYKYISNRILDIGLTLFTTGFVILFAQ